MRKKVVIAIIALLAVAAAGALFWAYRTGRIFGSASTTTAQFYVDIGTRKMKDGIPQEKIAAAIYSELSGKGFTEAVCTIYPSLKNPLGGGAAGYTSATADFTRKTVTMKSGITDYYFRVSYPNNLQSCAFSLYGVSNGTGDPKFGGTVLKISNPTPGMVVKAIFVTNYNIGSPPPTTSPTPSSVGTINGRVVTTVNGQKVGIDGATVQVRNVTGKSATTFGGGYYWIYGLNRGTYTLDAKKECQYGTGSTSVTVVVGKITTAPAISLIRDGTPTDKAKIEGYVKDSATGQVVPGAQVWYKRSNIDNDVPKKGGTADATGYYSICPLVTYPYKYSVGAWYSGYNWSEWATVTDLVNGQARRLDFVMKKL